METSVKSHLGDIRRRRGISAAHLAKTVGTSRQTIYAIEAGSFVPNTEVTLRLARALEVAVEELFTLAVGPPAHPEHVVTEILSESPVALGQAVRICRVGERRFSIPVNAAPYYLPEADGVVAKLGRNPNKVDLAIFGSEESTEKKLLMAGCDPAIGLMSRVVEKLGGVEIVSTGAASKLALRWLVEGKVHIAGSHLEDPATGEFNLPYLRSQYPGEDFVVVTFARWEEGFVTAAGNPLAIRRVEDLAQPKVTFMNREAGSGSRALLDRLLGESGTLASKVRGYDRVAHGHLAAAYAVLTGESDCCLATRSAAQTFGLGFLALQSERYDLVMRRETLELPAAQAMMDVLQRAALRRKLEVLAGYDTAQTGQVLA